MPQKNAIKIYVEDSYYHIYNRGVEKRNIFMDEMDYNIFINYLKEYLSPPEDETKTKLVSKPDLQGEVLQPITRRVKNYHKEIELLAYCLMPNHFHFLIKQNSKEAMKEFMRSLGTRYSMYFNKRHDRIGSLFQGTYKAVMINDEKQLLHLSRYIHVNPYPGDIVNAYSSYKDYLQTKKTPWVKTKMILSIFNNPNLDEIFLKKNNYKDFVESDAKSKEALGKLTLED